jgi:60 kDa SS-A/Ro ribonucleoprotein
MSSVNKISPLGQLLRDRITNQVGTPVKRITPEAKLNRLVLASMLWEKQFYLDGKSHAELVGELVAQSSAIAVSNLAIMARDKFKLRHIPLLLTRELARHGKLQASVLNQVVQRADEMSEFLSIYWKDGRTPLSNQVKKGLAQAFVKFDEYQLAKYDKNSSAVTLRDVMFLCHAKPLDVAQEALFKRVADGELKTPDTWETQLSAGADKKETFSRLMAEKRLGALAFLRNLRNMVQSGVLESDIRDYAVTVDVNRVLPFRYIAAAQVVPEFEDMLEKMMLRSLATLEKLPGKTVLLVDVSDSMFGTKISAKSDLDRFDAAAALAMLCNEVCESVEIYTFSNYLKRVAPRSGFALRDALSKSQPHQGTQLGASLDQLTSKHDRVIVFTDEQSYDRPGKPACERGYIVNVAAYENGVNHDSWTTISGFSEAIVDYIRESEKQ